MTKKHRSKKFSKIFKAHVDNENHEALLNREEIEKAVAKIFMLLGAENSSLISSENSYDKSELVSLVESFHKKYDTLRQHYEDLTESLRKNVRPRSKGNGSSSFDFSSSGSESSDSESDEFSDKRKKLSKTQESKVEQISSEEYRTLKLDSGNINNDELQAMATQMHAKLEEGRILVAELAEKNAVIVTLEEEFQATKNSVKVLQTERDDLKIELESSFKQKDEMIQTMSRILEENEALRSENTAAFTRIQEADKSVEEGETKFNQIKEELNEVKSANNVLVEELETTVQQVASLKQQLTTASEEKETLRSGNSKFLRRIQETEKALADFRGQANQELASATEDLTSQNASLSSENENLKLRLESAENQVADLIQRYSAIEEENNTLKSEIVSLLSRTQEAERTIRDLTADSELLRNEKLKSQEIYNDLKQKLEVKEVEMQTLTSEHLEAVKVVQQEQEKISKLSEEIKNLKDENSQLLINIGSMKLDLETSNKEVSESKQILEATQNEKHALIEENSALLSKIDEAEKVMNDLNTEKLQLEIDKSQLHMRTNYLDQELKEVNLQLADMIKAWEVTEEEKMKLAVENSGIMNKLQQMEVIIKELEQEIEVLRDEKSMLQQNQIKIQEAEKKIHDLNAETEQLKLDNSQLKIEVGALSLELEASTLRSADLNKMLGTAEEENNTLALENSGIMSKLQQAEIILKELEKEVEKLREENSMLQQDQTRAQEAEKIILDLKAETAKLEADNSQLKMEVSALSLELEGSTGRLADLNKMLGTADEENKTLALENSGIMSKLQQAEITIKELEKEVEKLREENSMLQQNQTRVQEAEKIILDLKSETVKLEADNSQLKREFSALSLELEGSTVRLADLNKMLGTAEEEKKTLALENSGIMGKLQQAEITINELEKELEKLRGENSIFQQVAEKTIRDLKTESEQLKVNNSQLKNEVGALGLELEASTLRFTDLNKVLETAEEEKNALALENSGVMSKLQQAEITINELEKELERLREENSIFQQNQISIQEAEKTIRDLKTEFEQLKVDNSQLMNEVGALGLELEASTLRYTDLNKVLETTEEEKNTLALENSGVMSKLQQAEITISELEEELGRLREENSIFQQNQISIQEAEKTIHDLKTEYEQLKTNNSQLNNEVSALGLELEASTLRFTDLNRVLEAVEEEKNALALENSRVMSKSQEAEITINELEEELEKLREEISMLQQNQISIQEAEETIHDLKTESEHLKVDNSQLKKEVGVLGLELEASTLRWTDLNKVLGTAEEEKKTLTSENSIIVSRLQQAEINVEKLENDLMQLREENSTLLQNQSKLQEAEKIMDALTTEKQQQRDDISQLEIQINELNLKLEAANLELTDLKKAIEAAHEEKAVLATELLELRGKLQQAEAKRQELEGELGQLQNEISMLEQNQNDLRHQNADLEVILDGKKSEMVALQTEIEEVKKEGLDQIEAMTMHMNDLQKERDLLTTKNNELEEQIKSLTCSSAEDQTQIKHLQDELESKSLREEIMLRNEKDRFDELLADYQKLEDRFRESCENLQIADRKTGELLEKLDLTVAEKADADRETAKLHQQVQTLEVQLRLLNQKFKITETENREKEEGNNRKMEALRKEQREVEDRMLRFSGRIGLLQNELSQLKEATIVRSAALTNDYCGLESMFEENSVHVQKRLSECAKELRILKIWLVELKNEKEDLSVRLKYKEGIISLMKDEATSIGEKLTKKEKELASLKTQAVESEKKIKVLDEMLTEKKKEVSDRDEAKREAIRQLCLLIEYHRENSNYLSQYLSSILKRRGRSS